ncbi:hypothetical protein GW17_00005610 [Ensete ventricosum]|nr:hypothetical protein GW17_00005610 [Ensete ventricosum]
MSTSWRWTGLELPSDGGAGEVIKLEKFQRERKHQGEVRGKEIHKTGQANDRMLAIGDGGLRVTWSLRSEAVGDGVDCVRENYGW